MVTIVEQLQQNFHENIFFRKYFVSLLFAWNVLSNTKIKFFGDKNYFTGWSRLLKSLLKLQLYRAVLSYFLQLVCRNLSIFVLNMFGQDCWTKTIWEAGLCVINSFSVKLYFILKKKLHLFIETIRCVIQESIIYLLTACNNYNTCFYMNYNSKYSQLFSLYF